MESNTVIIRGEAFAPRWHSGETVDIERIVHPEMTDAIVYGIVNLYERDYNTILNKYEIENIREQLGL